MFSSRSNEHHHRNLRRLAHGSARGVVALVVLAASIGGMAIAGSAASWTNTGSTTPITYSYPSAQRDTFSAATITMPGPQVKTLPNYSGQQIIKYTATVWTANPCDAALCVANSYTTQVAHWAVAKSLVVTSSALPGSGLGGGTEGTAHWTCSACSGPVYVVQEVVGWYTTSGVLLGTTTLNFNQKYDMSLSGTHLFPWQTYDGSWGVEFG